MKKTVKVSEHYDLLIENGNDPMLDCKELQMYMDRWDGSVFIDELDLNKNKTVLEIGCGTGRIVNKIKDLVDNYFGIDISAKTLEKAKQHFEKFDNIRFIYGDFITYKFERLFDLIYSTLTFIHIKNKRNAIKKSYDLLNLQGKFVVSIDKNQSDFIDTGYSKIKIYPDTPQIIQDILKDVGFASVNVRETDAAFILSAIKM